MTALARACALTIVAFGTTIGSQALAQMGQRPMQTAPPQNTMNQYQGLQYQGSDYQVPVSEVRDPETTLLNASVKDKDGDYLGKVRNVVMGSGGTPSTVDADVSAFLGVTNKVVALPARSLSYEKNYNVLITTLTRDEIKDLPST